MVVRQSKGAQSCIVQSLGPSLILISRASKVEAHVNHLTVQRSWSYRERDPYINVLELRAVCLAVTLPIGEGCADGNGQYIGDVLHQQTGRCSLCSPCAEAVSL